jgi:hypothetical protein
VAGDDGGHAVPDRPHGGDRGLADGLTAYEAARLEAVNAIVLACRDMPADRLLETVSRRAPGEFGRIEEVLSAAELASFDDAYRVTTLPDVAALNSPRR